MHMPMQDLFSYMDCVHTGKDFPAAHISHSHAQHSIEEENRLEVSDHSILNMAPLGPNTVNLQQTETFLCVCVRVRRREVTVRKLCAHLVPAFFYTACSGSLEETDVGSNQTIENRKVLPCLRVLPT